MASSDPIARIKSALLQIPNGPDQIVVDRLTAFPICLKLDAAWPDCTIGLDAPGRWKLMIETLGDPKIGPDFLARFSNAERNVLALLWEWWSNNKTDRHISSEIRAIFRMRPDLRTTSKSVSELWSSSLYNSSLSSLWMAECQDYSVFWRSDIYQYQGLPQESPSDLVSLKGVRRRVAQDAASRRLSDAWYVSTGVSSSKYQKAYYEKLLPSPVELIERLPTPSSCIEPCPWLPPPTKQGYPYYLWDIRRKRTVVVGQLNFLPEYSIISHTWGRWRDKTVNPVNVPGVPWPVPINTKFSVQDLPSMLETAISTDYVWIDLFCIPQDRSPLSQTEIARQAGIFQLAKIAIAWVNDVDDWAPFSNYIAWMSALYLKNNHADVYETNNLIEKIENSAYGETQLMRRSPVEKLYDGFLGRQPTPYLTSLWTLQELCLRSDMVLMDKNWNLLRLGSMAVRFDHFVTLFADCQSYIKKLPAYAVYVEYNTKDEPEKLSPIWRHYGDVARLVYQTGLSQLNDLTQTVVLGLGSQRYCEKNRAEAIMSVLGVTPLPSASGPQVALPSSTDMVIGKYPFSFVKEIRLKAGASFFNTIASADARLNTFVFGMLDRRLKSANFHGSFLPFSGHYQTINSTGTRADEEAFFDHPAVQGWQVQKDGSVQIKKAGIVASWFDTRKGSHSNTEIIAKQITCSVSVNSNETDPTHTTFKGENLPRWLGNFRKRSEKHAVALLRADNLIYGAILEKVYDKSAGSKFIKIGLFAIQDKLSASQGQKMDPVMFPQAQDVDWIVQ